MDAIAQVLADQDGVISRRQALECGETETAIKRRVRRREWVAVHPGVYVNHTGSLPWRQRAWAAVLFSWPAALSHDSALRAYEGPGRRTRSERAIQIAVHRDRNLTAPDGVLLRRTSSFDERVAWNLSPPRVRYEDAVLDCAAAAHSDLDAVAELADACGSRRTTARRLLDRAEARPRLPRRAWLRSVLGDVAEGTCSILEHGYLDRVERPHGLPRARRRALSESGGRAMMQDVRYEGLGQVVELDGRLFHDSSVARDRDLERDLDSVVAGLDTLRLGYGQVFARPCSTAAKVGQVLQARGWRGSPRSCPECGGSGQPG